jgi:formyl-CoA transferase
MPALDGLRVLDMTQYEAGPSCTQALAWLGADVVKVEPPGRGDPGRALGAADHSEYFLNWNANKRSVVIDLEKPAGRALLLRLVPHYDVFVENYGPGVVERLGLDYPAVREVHPGVIYARCKGFGTSGPYGGYKSFDMIAQAAAGAFSVTGMRDGPPMCPGPTTGDSGTGVQMALAIVAAYVQRLRTGRGQLVEISMQEAMTYFMRTRIATGSNYGRQAAPRNGNGFGAALNLYPCSPGGANDHVYIVLATRRMWEAMARAIGREDLLADPRFATGAAQLANGAALYEEIAAWTRTRDKFSVMRVLGEAGVPCSAVYDTRDLFEDPHLVERGFVQGVEHPVLGPVRLLGSPLRLSESAVELAPAPELGAHTEQVLAADLGLDAESIGALRADGVLG